MATNQKKWTSEEVEYLENSWGIIPLAKISKKLGRSNKAVSTKAGRLGLGKALDNTDHVTAKHIAKALGICAKTVVRWINDEELPAKHIALGKVRKNWLINIDDFWKWAENNQHLINLYKLEENILGKEPQWAKEKRKRDYRFRKREKKYSKAEDEEIIRNYGVIEAKEIAQALGRTPVSVRRRASRLNLDKKKIGIPWTEEEVIFMVKAKSRGQTYDEISIELGRTFSSVKNKYRDVIDKGLKACGYSGL